MKGFSEHQPGNDPFRGGMCSTGWGIFSKPIADIESAECLTDGIDGWGPQRARIVKIFLCTLAAVSWYVVVSPTTLDSVVELLFLGVKFLQGKNKHFPQFVATQ